MINILLLANFICTACYLLLHWKKGPKEALLFGAMFLCVPILGLTLYYVPVWMFQAVHRTRLYRRDDLITSGEQEIYPEKPDLKEELDLIPLKEALVVGDPVEKRKLVLDTLKENLDENYKTALSALSDKDSETSHYAASAVMEVQRRLRNRLLLLEKEYRDGASALPVQMAYGGLLREYLTSGLLSAKELKVNREKYIRWMERLTAGGGGAAAGGGGAAYSAAVDNEEYAFYITCLMEAGREEQALACVEVRLAKKPSEEMYFKLLEIHYTRGDQEGFDAALNRLMASEIVLSQAGMDQLRFWIWKKKGKKDAVS